MGTPTIEELFQRSLSGHLPPERFQKLRDATVLVAGLGGGSNIAELLARKGVGHLIIADLDVYEPHNVRQRGMLMSTVGREKVAVMRDRLRDIHPHLEVTAVDVGVTVENADELARRADFIADQIDFHGLAAKLALHRAARAHGKTVVTAPAIINGAVLYVFTPDGPSFEEFFGYVPGAPPAETALGFMKRLVPRYPPEAPESLYLAAARGERAIPLDAVGVDQASVLVVSAVENLALGRRERVIAIPRGVQVDVSDPSFLASIVDFSADFGPRR